MSDATVQIEDTRKQKPVAVPCSSCKRETHHTVLTSALETDGDENVTLWTHWQVVRCGGCKSVSFRKAQFFSEDYDAEIGEIPGTITYYPAPLTTRMTFENDLEALPEGVREVYEEAHKALSIGLRVLSAIGIRALVEAVCMERKAKSWGLKDKLDDLVKANLLTRDEEKILIRVAVLGDAGAHRAQPGTDEALNAAMEVAEHLLVKLYRLPVIARQLPKHRRKAKKGKTPPP
jgi:hypothetical protein